MTSEELEGLVRGGKPARLAEALTPLGEKERKKLSKTAAGLYRLSKRGELQPGITMRLGKAVNPFSGSADHLQHTATILAVLGLCPISQARRVDLLSLTRQPQKMLLKVLLDRRPTCLADWLDIKLSEEWTPLSWTTVRTLVREGACLQPSGDGYLRLMVQGLSFPQHPNGEPYRPLSERLLDDGALLEDEVWRLFEADTTAFTNDWEAHDPSGEEGHESWPTALVTLCEAGKLDRARLLDASLQSLSTDRNSPTLSGLHKFHSQLAPSAEELADRQQAYMDLLGHATEHVVGFALKTLASLDKHERLDAEAFIRAVGPVFRLRYKSQPAAALRLLKRAVIERPDRVAQAAASASDALTHQSAHVQEQALGLLEDWHERCGPDLAEGLAVQTEGLAPPLRPRAEALLNALGAAGAPPDREPEAVDSEAELASLKERAAALSPTVKELSGLTDLERMSQWDALPSPLQFDIVDAPVLSGIETVAPLEDVDALFEALAHGLEVVDTADEVERLLDGISRLCDQRPPDFDQRAAPLVKRVNEVTGTGSGGGLLANYSSASWVLRDLVLIWLAGTHRPTPVAQRFARPGPIPFFEARGRELTERVATRQAAPLLAAPTHAHGWIEPARLVERLAALEIEDIQAPRFDLIQALLRLAPEGRAPALAEAGLLRSPAGRILRFALGSDDRPTVMDQANAPLWLAAGRARWPAASLTEALTALRFPVDGPDLAEPATYEWRASFVDVDHYGRKVSRPGIELEVGPGEPLTSSQEDEDLTPFFLDPLSEVAGDFGSRLRSTFRHLGRLVKRAIAPANRGPDPRRDYPTLALHHVPRQPWQNLDISAPWLVHLGALVWPLNGESYFARGVRAMMGRIDDDASNWDPHFPYLQPLFEPDRPLTEMALVALWVGLLSKDGDVRGLTVDALIETIQDGRAHPEPLAEVLSRIAAGGWLKPNRLAETLHEVSRVSALHQLVVAQVLQRYLADLEALPKNAHHLLELLLGLLSELQRPLDSPPPAVLGSVKGASKTAKLARSLLAGPASLSDVRLNKAVVSAYAARVERVERWERGGRGIGLKGNSP